MALREVPTFYPTMEEFKDFSGYIAKIEQEGAHLVGLAKVVPPRPWAHRRPIKVDHPVLISTIDNPIEQNVIGSKGMYTMMNMEKKMMSVHEFQDFATRKDKVAPPHKDYDDLERIFWRERPYGQVLYGADIPGSHFDTSLKEWNLRSLDTILKAMLDQEGKRLPGVNEPMLYYGMWKSSFCWHVEDMNLYSINYVHAGAPKTWYCIPPQHGDRFESLVEGLCPGHAQNCPQFLRHKMTLMSPTSIKNAGVPVFKVTQEPGEFIITFPFAYHQGFNHGFNIAEATNFASPRWIDYGLNCKKCYCLRDSVNIQMDYFVKNYRPELWAKWEKERLTEEEESVEEAPLTAEKKSRQRPKLAGSAFCPPVAESKSKQRRAARQKLQQEKEFNRKAAKVDNMKLSQLICAVCCEVGPSAPGTEQAHADLCGPPSTPQIFKTKRKANVVTGKQKGARDTSSSSEEDFECESGCGFQSVDRRVVEDHESSCPRLAAMRGTSKAKLKQQKEAMREVIMCHTCGVAVHRHCYNVSPSTCGDLWQCDRCVDRRAGHVQCGLCPRIGGAFKKTANKKWVHLQCALAIPGLVVSVEEDVLTIPSLDEVPAAQHELQCTWCLKQEDSPREQNTENDCKLSSVGHACVQCSVENCPTAFHVTCGQRDPNLHVKMKQKLGAAAVTQAHWQLFCSRHCPTSVIPTELAVGTLVWARWKNRCFYEGKISSVNKTLLCEVLLSDGTVRKNVDKTQLRDVGSLSKKVQKALAKSKEQQASQRGVECSYALQQDGDTFMACQLLAESQKVTYGVELHDGSVKTLSRCSVLTQQEMQGKVGQYTFVNKEVMMAEEKQVHQKRLRERRHPEKDLLPKANKRQRAKHDYAALNSGGQRSSRAMEQFWTQLAVE